MALDMDREQQAREAEKKSVGPLLRGAIDLHYHGYPEITLRLKSRLDDVDVLKLAIDMGMRAVVIKSQMWPTMGTVYHLRQRVPGIECFASITLNTVAGGLSPWAVEAAARQGARVVWLPTWSSLHLLGKNPFSSMMKGWFPEIRFEPGLSCVDSSGKLSPDVKSIIRLCKEMNLVLCTGHIAPGESLAVAQEAEHIGFSRLVFTHPLSGAVDATQEQAKEMVKRGAYVELCALNLFEPKALNAMPEMIAAVGADHCILTTDAFREWLPPGPEFLRMFIGRLLLISGIGEEDIKRMVQDNPAALLGLDV